MAVAAVHRVGARGKRLALLAAVRRGAGRPAVDHVGGDGQDGGRGDGVAVGVVLAHVLHKPVHDAAGDVVHAVVVVAVLGEVALHLVIDGQAGFVADDLDAGVLDGRQGICDNGQSCDARGEPAGHVLVVQRHLQLLVAVFVVHVVDDVEGVDVHLRQPAHHRVELLHDLVVVEVLAGDRRELRADLLVADLVHAAVDGVQQALGQVGARAEELHFQADAHGGHAAGDTVVVAVGEAHHIVVLVLDGRRFDGHLRAVALEVRRQVDGPEHRQVRLRGRAEVGQRVQVAVAHLCHQVAAVDGHAADGLGDPLRIAGEELVVFRRAGKLHHAQLHDEVVDHLLDFLLGEQAAAQVALSVDIQERAGAAQGHRRAVLLLDGAQVAEVQPLDRFLHVARRAADVKAVAGGHLLELAQRADLLGELLALLDDLGVHRRAGLLLLLELVLNQAVHAVERHAAVVADDAAAAVGVRQAGDDVAGAAGAHLRGVGVKHARVVRLAVYGEELAHPGIDRVAVILAGLLRHADAAVGHERALERLVRLQSDDLLLVLVKIPRAVGGDGGDDLRVHVQHAALGDLLLRQRTDLIPQVERVLRRPLEEILIAIVGRVVVLDKAADVDLAAPGRALEAVPLLELVVHVIQMIHASTPYLCS